eukprot:scaffold16096_cov61-Cylindrotheca_fusiformis.AAC.1
MTGRIGVRGLLKRTATRASTSPTQWIPAGIRRTAVVGNGGILCLPLLILVATNETRRLIVETTLVIAVTPNETILPPLFSSIITVITRTSSLGVRLIGRNGLVLIFRQGVPWSEE